MDNSLGDRCCCYGRKIIIFPKVTAAAVTLGFSLLVACWKWSWSHGSNQGARARELWAKIYYFHKVLCHLYRTLYLHVRAGNNREHSNQWLYKPARIEQAFDGLEDYWLFHLTNLFLSFFRTLFTVLLLDSLPILSQSSLIKDQIHFTESSDGFCDQIFTKI